MTLVVAPEAIPTETENGAFKLNYLKSFRNLKLSVCL